MSFSHHLLSREQKSTSHCGLIWITASKNVEIAKQGLPKLISQCTENPIFSDPERPSWLKDN